ncbi:MAG: hypothetical protein BWK79_11660 [Beggiatoa sp. IS2]|nr:MAG: hypothetical protein BWK79_11660 [Beggiatoa sp. IS2]
MLPSASGRQRYNVLGAYNPFTHQVITVTNESYTNQQVFCLLLEEIAQYHAGMNKPVTLVLDNARYQKSQMIADASTSSV